MCSGVRTIYPIDTIKGHVRKSLKFIRIVRHMKSTGSCDSKNRNDDISPDLNNDNFLSLKFKQETLFYCSCTCSFICF